MSSSMADVTRELAKLQESLVALPPAIDASAITFEVRKLGDAGHRAAGAFQVLAVVRERTRYVFKPPVRKPFYLWPGSPCRRKS